MKTFDTSESLKRGWELFRANKKLLIFASIIAISLSIGVGGDYDDNTIGFNVFLIFFGILMWVISTIVDIGYIMLGLKLERGESSDLRELFAHSGLFLRYVVGGLAYSLAFLIGFVLLIIPGFYFALKYIFVPLLMIDKELGLKEAFKESARMTKGVKWKLAGFCLVQLGVFILGILTLVVGVVVAIPVSMLAYLHIYRNLGQEISPITAEIPSL